MSASTRSGSTLEARRSSCSTSSSSALANTVRSAGGLGPRNRLRLPVGLICLTPLRSGAPNTGTRSRLPVTVVVARTASGPAISTWNVWPSTAPAGRSATTSRSRESPPVNVSARSSSRSSPSSSAKVPGGASSGSPASTCPSPSSSSTRRTLVSAASSPVPEAVRVSASSVLELVALKRNCAITRSTAALPSRLSPGSNGPRASTRSALLANTTLRELPPCTPSTPPAPAAAR